MEDPLFRSRVYIPDDNGTVAQYFQAETGKKKVVCLVKVYGPYESEADSNFGKILEIYLRNSGIRLICWENAEGPLELNQMSLSGEISSVLANYQSAKKLFRQTLKTTKSLIKAFLSARSTIKIFGVDNMGWADEMRKVQEKALSSWPKYQPVFETLRKELHKAASDLRKPEIQDLITFEEGWENSSVGFAELSQHLLDLADRVHISLPVDVLKCLIANVRGTQLRPEAVEKERDELLARVQMYAKYGSTIRQDMVSELLKDALEDSTGSFSEQLTKAQRHVRRIAEPLSMPALDVTKRQIVLQPDRNPIGGFNLLSRTVAMSAMYLEVVFDLARALKIDLLPYSNLAHYAEQMNLLSSIAGTTIAIKMGDKINLAFRTLESKVVDTPQEKAILVARRRLDLLERLGQMILTPERYDMLMADLDDSTLEKVIETLASQGRRFSTPVRDKARDFDKERDYFSKFYDRARKRASGMAKRTLGLMEEQRTDVAILICLGFHIPSVCNVLSANRASYTVIHPKFTLQNADEMEN